MTKSMTEQLGERATDALHQAIQIAWQAGYDQALNDMENREAYYLKQAKEEE